MFFMGKIVLCVQFSDAIVPRFTPALQSYLMINMEEILKLKLKRFKQKYKKCIEEKNYLGHIHSF